MADWGQKIVGLVAIVGGLLVLAVPLLNLGSIPALIIGIYLLTRKRKLIG